MIVQDIPRDGVLMCKMVGVDWVQENVFKQGAQDNESAVEQAKDEQISGRLNPAHLTHSCGGRISMVTLTAFRLHPQQVQGHDWERHSDC